MSNKIYHLTINERQYKVEVENIGESEAKLKCNDKTYTVQLDELERIGAPVPKAPVSAAAAPAAAPAAAAPAAAASSGGGNAVNAPIPGAILSIAVKEGDSVTAGQSLLKMEAMKMENDITASAAGTITKLHVAVGDSVAQGQALVEIG